ncbi:hypothetical protein IKK_05630 [Bacillus mycoides]|nr:hypothetical protein IKK_05630 [Bacillus mycoides]OSY03316.1 hypothetical protein S2E19_03005 [Bacillus mycoides]
MQILFNVEEEIPQRFNVFLIIVPVEIMEQAIVTLVKK